MATTVATIVYELKQQGIEVSSTAVRNYIKKAGFRMVDGRFIRDTEGRYAIIYFKLKNNTKRVREMNKELKEYNKRKRKRKIRRRLKNGNNSINNRV